MKPEVSIIVPVFNGFNAVTKQFLDSILKTTKDVEFELIIVSNGSTDETTDQLRLIAGGDSRVVPLLLEENKGFSGGNNAGFAKARGKYVLFMNNDVVIHDPLWLRKFCDYKAKNPMSVIGQQLIVGNTWTSYRNKPTEYLGGWCVFASREDFLKVGIWDEDYGKGFFEDVWMSIQFKDLGYTLKELDVKLEHLGSKTVSKLSPDFLTTFARIVYINKLIAREKKDKLRIVFFYDSTFSFNDEDYEGRGVGGSEASLILLSRKLAAAGHVVDIYSPCKVTGQFHGVHWNHISDFNHNHYCDVFVMFRNINPVVKLVYSRAKIFWSCDQYTNGNYTLDCFPFVDWILTISPFHMDYLSRRWGAPHKKLSYLDLGIKELDYLARPEKKKNKLIFCSVPERGLKYMFEAFPKIQEQIPDVELVVTSDYTLWGDLPLNDLYKGGLEKIKGIRFLGKVKREELVKEQLTSEIMAYPCDYDENFCISAAECIASGTVPVTSRHGALPTTVGKNGVIMRHKYDESGFVPEFVMEVCQLLKNPNTLEVLRNKCFSDGQRFFWSTLVSKYLELFKDVMQRKEVLDMHKCDICGKKFKTSFEMFRHRNETHEEAIKKVQMEEGIIYYKIRTRKLVEISVNSFFWTGTQFEIPREYAAEFIRIVTQVYGGDIIEYESIEID